MFITVGMASSRRTGPTCRIAGCISGANMNTIPASRSARAITSGPTSIGTPSASSTSALPHCEVKDRLPCLATRTPSPAARSAAAVEMLKVPTAPPPVPQVSTSSSGRSATRRTMAPRRASAAPATSAGVSPFTRRPMSSAASCADVASPLITAPNAARDSGSESELPIAS